MLIGRAQAANIVAVDVITLSGETVTGFAIFPGDASASIKADNNGNVYKRTNGGSWTQVDTLTDWVRPAGSAPGLYQVRFTNLVGDAVSASAAEDIWHALSSGDFIVTLTNTGVGFDTSAFDIEIRYDGGATLDSAEYILHADVEP